MSELKSLIIFLSQYDLTSAKICNILDVLAKPSISAFKKSKNQFKNLINEKVLNKMLDCADEAIVHTYTLNLANKGIKIVTKFDEDFPRQLQDLPDAPVILYYMGDLNLVNTQTLAVVGTRKPSNYGYMVTERLVRDATSAGITIVSGLAYGVDSIAHRKCLELGGKTIAVLGGGFEHIYPLEHHSLAMEIAEKGLLLSEYRPKMNATKYTFPTRNRIVAGLSDGVLITEAGIKSGTIHTKDFALEYGKNIYAVPGNIDSPNSELTNQIIKYGQAACVTQSDDILRDYQNLNNKENVVQPSFFDASDEEKIIIECLKDGMKSIDELTKKCKLSMNIFNNCLTTLEISGIIKRLPGGLVALN